LFTTFLAGNSIAQDLPQIAEDDEAAQQHIGALERLLSALTPEEKEIIEQEIRYKAHLLQDVENVFYRDMMEQRCMISIRTTRGTVVNIPGKEWPEN